MSAARQQVPPRLNPLWYRALKKAYTAGVALGLVGPVDAGRLIDKARRAEGGRSFSDDSFKEGFEVLCRSAESEAKLNGFGRLMLNQLSLNLLRNRLRLESWRQQHPGVLQQTITAPLIIAGLPRTGTTFLFGLLSQDEQFRAPLTFEVDRPVPPPSADAPQRDSRVREVQRGIDIIHRIVPHLSAIHAIGALLPNECQQITAYQFSSITFQHVLDVPSYREWLLARDYTPDLAFHKQFLQHLQSSWRRDRWLLKSPHHVQYLQTLLATYPDAKIIHTHRHPTEVLGSISSLSWTMQDVFSDHASRTRAGKGQLHYWERALEATLHDRECLGQSEAIFDLRYHDLMASPLDTIQRLYDQFGLALTSSTLACMERYLADNSQGKSGRHIYHPADFGVEQVAGRAVFRAYSDRFLRGQ